MIDVVEMNAPAPPPTTPGETTSEKDAAPPASDTQDIVETAPSLPSQGLFSTRPREVALNELFANGRVDVESLRKLPTLMLDKLKWLEKPVNVDEMADLSFLPR